MKIRHMTLCQLPSKVQNSLKFSESANKKDMLDVKNNNAIYNEIHVKEKFKGMQNYKKGKTLL